MSAPEMPENFRASFRLYMRDVEPAKDVENRAQYLVGFGYLTIEKRSAQTR
jgi:hypothetical protein